MLEIVLACLLFHFLTLYRNDTAPLVPAGSAPGDAASNILLGHYSGDAMYSSESICFLFRQRWLRRFLSIYASHELDLIEH